LRLKLISTVIRMPGRNSSIGGGSRGQQRDLQIVQRSMLQAPRDRL
jgi:hypothetical protein